ncbi:hypothetical protein D3C71_1559380 [compost metagenome]
MAEHVDRAAGLGHQGREDADGGGFAGAIGAEQGEKIAFGDIQVDAMQRLEAIAVGFGQLPDGQSGTHKKCTHLKIKKKSKDGGCAAQYKGKAQQV